MFETIGVPELLIILAIVMLLFGAGKVGRLGKDLGTSVKEFRRALKDEEDTPPQPAPAAGVPPPAPQPPVYQQSAPPPTPQEPPRGPQLF